MEVMTAKTLATYDMAVKHASDLEKDTWAAESGGKDNRKTFKTPLAASKHIKGGLSLNRARVEEGHCEMLVAGAELLPETLGAMVVYDLDGDVGEQSQGSRFDLAKVPQMSFIDNEGATWEEVLPLNYVHPSRNNNIQGSEWVLHKVKEIQTLCRDHQ